MSVAFFFRASSATAALFLLVQACSSSEATTGDDAGGPTPSPSGDAATDSAADATREAEASADSDAAADAGADAAADTGPRTNCPTGGPITEADLGRTWMPPFAVRSVCTQQAIDSLKTLYATNTDGGLTFTSIQSALGPSCSACVFSPEISDGGLTPNWSVYIEVDGGAQGTLFVDNRTGSCFARYSNNTCGKLRWEFERCLRIACLDCTTTSATTQCKRDAQNGACKDITNAYATACPNETDLIADCDNIYKTIAASCSGGPDSGIDASL
jgi:hypothetical protein